MKRIIAAIAVCAALSGVLVYFTHTPRPCVTNHALACK